MIFINKCVAMISFHLQSPDESKFRSDPSVTSQVLVVKNQPFSCYALLYCTFFFFFFKVWQHLAIFCTFIDVLILCRLLSIVFDRASVCAKSCSSYIIVCNKRTTKKNLPFPRKKKRKHSDQGVEYFN